MWQEVWLRHQGLFRRLARSVLRNDALAEDVVGDVYLRLHRENPRFAEERKAFNYCYRAVINGAIDAYRANRRQNESKSLVARLGPAGDAQTQQDSPLEELLGREEQRERLRLADEVQSAVRRLPKTQRQALHLFFSRKDRSVEEVCREAGVPYSTFRDRVSSGIERLRRQLKARGLLGEKKG